MTPGTFVLAAALFAWGPVAPPAQAPGPGTTDPIRAVPEMAPPPLAPPASAAPAPAAPPPVATPMIAKAPIDVRARPVLIAAPAPRHEPSKPLYKQWAFWAIAGGFLAATVAVTIIATRPAPEAYRGNAPPYYMPFP